ncbi:hypothetical protein niasHT_015515 [Heterodera trifolii]|uniref:DM2 domain-containing protein n=1 Tax=Heterodera trifolii TaxID=157864 RepID=A0ABD2L068_9BILA
MVRPSSKTNQRRAAAALGRATLLANARMQMALLPVSVIDAEKEIKTQIAEKGLNVITSQMIRKHLEAKFNCHLDGFKNEIDQIIGSCVSESNASSNAIKVQSPASDSSESDFDFPSTTSNSNGGKKKTNGGAKRRRTQTADEAEAEDLATAVKRRRSANQSAPKKRSQKTKDTDKKGGGNRKRNSAFSKICLISAELSTLLGKQYMRRSDVVKEMWAYFRSNNLLDPKNKQFVILDESLKRVFGQKTRIKAFGMMSELKKYVKDVAMLDDAARAKAEADIAEILAREEANNELVKDEVEEEQEMTTANHSDETAGNSGANSSLSESCAADPTDEAVQPLKTEHETAIKQEMVGQSNASDESSEEEGEDSADDSSQDSDSD